MNTLSFVRPIWFFAALMALMSLTACGGGGGGQPASGTSNWDQMVWDQDNWG